MRCPVRPVPWHKSHTAELGGVTSGLPSGSSSDCRVAECPTFCCESAVVDGVDGGDAVSSRGASSNVCRLWHFSDGSANLAGCGGTMSRLLSGTMPSFSKAAMSFLFFSHSRFSSFAMFASSRSHSALLFFSHLIRCWQ
jgi:hypothetical protein